MIDCIIIMRFEDLPEWSQRLYPLCVFNVYASNGALVTQVKGQSIAFRMETKRFWSYPEMVGTSVLFYRKNPEVFEESSQYLVGYFPLPYLVCEKP